MRLFGIVRNLGIDREEEKKKHSRARLVGKPVRIFIYCMGAAGGIAAFAGLGALFGGSAGLPQFDAKHTISWIQWAWFLGIVAAAILAGLCYLFFAKVSEKLGEMLQNHRIVPCVFGRGLHRDRDVFSATHYVFRGTRDGRTDGAAGRSILRRS